MGKLATKPQPLASSVKVPQGEKIQLKAACGGPVIGQVSTQTLQSMHFQGNSREVYD